jgi:hypothetical protein
MASYELVFKKSAAKDLRRLPKQDLQRIRALADDPRPAGCESYRLWSATAFVRARIASSMKSRTPA